VNPYTILEVPPGADNATVTRAMATALKARKHPPQVLAEAQRMLLSPERRMLADFMLPLLPAPHRLGVPPEPPLPPELPPWPHEDYAELARAAGEAIARDVAEAQAVADTPVPLDAGATP
jgi:hypothetical protein